MKGIWIGIIVAILATIGIVILKWESISAYFKLWDDVSNELLIFFDENRARGKVRIQLFVVYLISLLESAEASLVCVRRSYSGPARLRWSGGP